MAAFVAGCATAPAAPSTSTARPEAQLITASIEPGVPASASLQCPAGSRVTGVLLGGEPPRVVQLVCSPGAGAESASVQRATSVGASRFQACVDGNDVAACIGAARTMTAEGVALTPRAVELVTRALELTWEDLQALRLRLEDRVRPPGPVLVDPLNDKLHSDKIHKVGAYTYEVLREARGQLVGSPERLAHAARIIPNYRQGRYEGVKLVGVRPGSLYRAIGIRSGDVIRAVNGKNIDAPSKAIALAEGLLKARVLRIELERRGSPITLVIRFVKQLSQR